MGEVSTHCAKPFWNRLPLPACTAVTPPIPTRALIFIRRSFLKANAIASGLCCRPFACFGGTPPLFQEFLICALSGHSSSCLLFRSCNGHLRRVAVKLVACVCCLRTTPPYRCTCGLLIESVLALRFLPFFFHNVQLGRAHAGF